ncbi:DNA repair protein rad18, partial [Teratosphaeria nubilosa]
MDPSMDIPDATDWLNTPLRQFSDLESALHCEICKEFYDTPMITSCSHTFCSKCIRTSLSADGKCPACRTADQASKLRNNWALQTVVATFLAARPEALSLARREQELAAQSHRPGKRKREVTGPDDMEQTGGEGRTTRSKSRRVAASQPEAIEIGDSDEGGDADFEPELPPDGLVECPLGCGKRMKIEQVEPHLDRCEDEKKQASRAKPRTSVNGFGHSRSSSQHRAKPQERLAELNYSLLKDQAMRKKLEELGIPTSGSKQLMVRRHTEWVNIWNANCDSNNPRSKRELLRELDAWERTQGSKAPPAQNTSASAIMRKDFDGNGWAKKNKDEFSRLIADARRKK